MTAKEIPLQIPSIFNVFDAKERIEVYPLHHDTVVEKALNKADFFVQCRWCKRCSTAVIDVGASMALLNILKVFYSITITIFFKSINLSSNNSNLLVINIGSLNSFKE